MKKVMTALQLYSVRDAMKEDFEGTLKKVKDMGYQGVEFAGVFEHSVEEVKKICSELNLVPISAHVPLPDLQKDETLEYYKKLGCKYVVIPHLKREFLPGGPDYKEFTDIVLSIGKKVNKLGMKLYYHNHDFEFVKIDGKYKLEKLYEDIPADILSVQLDTCWANVGGVNPAQFLRKYEGRTNMVHLKDFVGTKTDRMYELIGVKPEDLPTKPTEFELRPVGMGKQNIPEIMEAVYDMGIEWVIVEQDTPSAGKTPLECATLSAKYLNSIIK